MYKMEIPKTLWIRCNIYS